MKYAVAFVCVTLFALAPSLRAEFDPPVPVRTVPPQFPDEMRRQHVNGIVMVSCQIDPDGHVQDPRVVKTNNEAFSEPAMAAVKMWKFKPARRDGTAVAIRVTIPMKFTIDD